MYSGTVMGIYYSTTLKLKFPENRGRLFGHERNYGEDLYESIFNQ